MFKLYNEISALGQFSTGFMTNLIDSIDSMQWWQASCGVAYICPKKTDYYSGHGINLFIAPAQDVTGEYLTDIWDEHIARKAPNAVKSLISWESDQFVDYKNIDDKYGLECEVILKFSPSKKAMSRPHFNIKNLSRADAQQLTNIYIASNGEGLREFTNWMTENRMQAIEAEQCNFFAIWNEEKNEIAAVAGLFWCNGIFRYASVNTRESYRGRGYCSALIAHIRDYALERGAKEIYIIADKDSQAAGIYMNAGFEVSSYEYTILADRSTQS